MTAFRQPLCCAHDAVLGSPHVCGCCCRPSTTTFRATTPLSARTRRRCAHCRFRQRRAPPWQMTWMHWIPWWRSLLSSRQADFQLLGGAMACLLLSAAGPSEVVSAVSCQPGDGSRGRLAGTFRYFNCCGQTSCKKAAFGLFRGASYFSAADCQGQHGLLRSKQADQLLTESDWRHLHNLILIKASLQPPKLLFLQVLMTRPRDEWRHDVALRYRALEQFSKEDARLQFLRILRSLPYGGAPLAVQAGAGHLLLAFVICVLQSIALRSCHVMMQAAMKAAHQACTCC